MGAAGEVAGQMGRKAAGRAERPERGQKEARDGGSGGECPERWQAGCRQGRTPGDGENARRRLRAGGASRRPGDREDGRPAVNARKRQENGGDRAGIYGHEETGGRIPAGGFAWYGVLFMSEICKGFLEEFREGVLADELEVLCCEDGVLYDDIGKIFVIVDGEKTLDGFIVKAGDLRAEILLEDVPGVLVDFHELSSCLNFEIESGFSEGQGFDALRGGKKLAVQLEFLPVCEGGPGPDPFKGGIAGLQL